MPKEVVIISGKGGTGKTSLTGSLAALAKNKIMVDCDVDAADLNLILNGKISATHDFTAGSRSIIDPEICTACGECLEYCRFDAIVDAEKSGTGYYLIDKLSCEGCGVCSHFCPENAITMHPVTSGQWFISKTPYGPLIHARLGIAEANSGKLVSILRNTARTIGENQGNDIIFIDGPPGIGCPVIASITGTDLALIVTEPSLSGFHDMERLLQLTSHFNIKSYLCINKSDINEDLTGKIEKFAEEKQIEVIGKIPYNRGITEAQLKGLPYPAYSRDGIYKNIAELWCNLKVRIDKLDSEKTSETNSKSRTDTITEDLK